MADGSVKIDTKFDLKNLPGEMKKLGGALKSGIAGAAKIAGVGLGAVAAGIGAVSVAAKKFADTTDRIDKMRQAIGFSVQGFQEWDYILGQNGASMDSMKMGMKAMLEQAQMSDGAFSKLGISVTDTTGKMKTQEELFAEAVKALQGMEEGSEKASLAQDIFSRSAQDLMPLLNQTAEGTEALRQNAHALGAVLSEEAVTSGVAFGDAMDDLKKAGSGLMNNVIAPMIPIFTDLAKEITSAVSSGKNMEIIKDVMGNIITIVKSLIAALKPVGKIIADILVWFVEWITEFDVLNKVVEFLGKVVSASFSFIKKAIGAVWVAWAQIVTFFETTAHKIGGFFKNLGSDIDVAFSVGFNGAKIAMVSMYSYLVTKLLGGVRKFLDVLGKLPFVGEKFQAASDAVGRVSDAVAEGAEEAKRASAEKIAAAKADRDATEAAVEANIEAVKKEGDARIKEAKRVAEAIEEFEFKPKKSGGSSEGSGQSEAVEESNEQAAKTAENGSYEVAEVWWKGFLRGVKNNTLKGVQSVKAAMVQIGAGLKNALAKVSSITRSMMGAVSKMVAFDPQATLASLDEILKGVTRFFMQDLGSLPIFFKAGAKMLIDFTNGIKNNLANISATASNVIRILAEMLIANAPAIIATGFELITVLALAIIENLPVIITAALEMIVAFALAIADNAPAIIEAFIAIIPQVVVALIQAIPQLVAAAFSMAFSLVEGIINGILQFGKNIWNGIKKIFTDMWNAILGFFGIRSPSTEGVALGGNIIQGIINGILSFGAGIWDAVKGVFMAFWDHLKNFFSGVWDWVSSTATNIWDGAKDVAATVWDTTKDVAGGIWEGVKNVGSGIWEGVKSVGSSIGGAVKGAWDWVTGWFADGTNSAPAGWAVVGEEGPELVQMGGGERIYPADQTAAILSAGAGAVAGLSAGGMGGMATIVNNLEAILKIDEYEIGRASYRTVDRFAQA